MSAVVRTLLLVLGLTAAVTPGAGAEETVESLKERILELQNSGKLGLRNLTLCRTIATYGQYARNDTRSVARGEVIWFYYEPENMSTQKERDVYRIWYTQDIILLTKEGKEILRSDEVLTFNHVGFTPVLDLYATNELDLGELPAGEYRYRVVLHDKIRGAQATAEVAFTITP